MKLLGRRAHGVVDYSSAATQLALAAMLPAGHRARVMLATSGLATGILGMVTNYELGVLRVVPMRGHLAADGGLAAAFGAAAATLDGAPARTAFGGLALVGATATALTDPDRP